MTNDDEIEALRAQVALLQEQMGQAIAMTEANNALILALVAQARDREALLANYQSMCRQLEASPVHQRRTAEQKVFVQQLNAHLMLQLRAKSRG